MRWSYPPVDSMWSFDRQRSTGAEVPVSPWASAQTVEQQVRGRLGRIGLAHEVVRDYSEDPAH
jgi:hypothetical protein